MKRNGEEEKKRKEKRKKFGLVQAEGLPDKGRKPRNAKGP
jgi:hypothetical protein